MMCTIGGGFRALVFVDNFLQTEIGKAVNKHTYVQTYSCKGLHKIITPGGMFVFQD